MYYKSAQVIRKQKLDLMNIQVFATFCNRILCGRDRQSLQEIKLEYFMKYFFSHLHTPYGISTKTFNDPTIFILASAYGIPRGH